MFESETVSGIEKKEDNMQHITASTKQVKYHI